MFPSIGLSKEVDRSAGVMESSCKAFFTTVIPAKYPKGYEPPKKTTVSPISSVAGDVDDAKAVKKTGIKIPTKRAVQMARKEKTDKVWLGSQNATY